MNKDLGLFEDQRPAPSKMLPKLNELFPGSLTNISIDIH